MSTLTVVVCHREGQEAYDRHLPYWKAKTDDFIIYSPSDSRIETTERQISHGEGEHFGARSMERVFWLLRWLEGTTADRFIIHEYDSISFAQPSIFSYTGPEALQGIWMGFGPCKNWLGTQFVHPPYSMRRQDLESLVCAYGLLPFHANRGCGDRFIGAVCHLHGIIPMKYQEGEQTIAYSENTIKPENFGTLREKLAHGARHFHGVKSREALEIILSAL